MQNDSVRESFGWQFEFFGEHSWIWRDNAYVSNLRVSSRVIWWKISGFGIRRLTINFQFWWLDELQGQKYNVCSLRVPSIFMMRTKCIISLHNSNDSASYQFGNQHINLTFVNKFCVQKNQWVQLSCLEQPGSVRAIIYWVFADWFFKMCRLTFDFNFSDCHHWNQGSKEPRGCRCRLKFIGYYPGKNPSWRKVSVSWRTEWAVRQCFIGSGVPYALHILDLRRAEKWSCWSGWSWQNN